MTPVWNQEISFAWVYPSLAQRFLILVIMQEHLQWKCVAEYEMSFEDIAFNGQFKKYIKTFPFIHDAYWQTSLPLDRHIYICTIQSVP